MLPRLMILWFIVQVFIFGEVGSISKVYNISEVSSSDPIKSAFKNCHLWSISDTDDQNSHVSSKNDNKCEMYMKTNI